MTEHEKYQEHIRHTHDAFCKTVIRHAAIDAARSIRSRRKREISLEYLIEEKHYPFHTCVLLYFNWLQPPPKRCIIYSNIYSGG